MDSRNSTTSHPLYPVLIEAIHQAMYGKGERHGGHTTPFLSQPWVHYHAMHGRGFLTGQAAKKLEEAASQRAGAAFEAEMLGAIVYAAMAILAERGLADEAPPPPGGEAETGAGGVATYMAPPSGAAS